MDAVLFILKLMIALGSLGCAVYWGAVLYQIIRNARGVPTAMAGLALELPEHPPSVCVVVPAHNEADVIASLVRSLRAQTYPSMHAVIVLDRCTDETEAIARQAAAGDDRFTIMPIDACPDDWAGKVHAIWRGVCDAPEAVNADLLLFSDADTTFDPRLINATVGLLLDRKLDMLSLIARLPHDELWAKVCQPVAGFELLRRFPFIRANRAGKEKRAFANGQFMLFRAEAYRAFGGHERVRKALLEDIAFAHRMTNRGHEVGVVFAGGLLHCRMYRSWDAFVRGWKRIYTEALNVKQDRLRSSARRLRLTGIILPMTAFAGIIAGLMMPDLFWMALLGALGIVAFFVTTTVACVVGGAPFYCGLVFPVGAWVVGRILHEAADDLKNKVPIRWGGREYHRSAR